MWLTVFISVIRKCVAEPSYVAMPNTMCCLLYCPAYLSQSKCQYFFGPFISLGLQGVGTLALKMPLFYCCCVIGKIAGAPRLAVTSVHWAGIATYVPPISLNDLTSLLSGCAMKEHSSNDCWHTFIWKLRQ